MFNKIDAKQCFNILQSICNGVENNPESKIVKNSPTKQNGVVAGSYTFVVNFKKYTIAYELNEVGSGFYEEVISIRKGRLGSKIISALSLIPRSNTLTTNYSDPIYMILNEDKFNDDYQFIIDTISMLKLVMQ